MSVNNLGYSYCGHCGAEYRLFSIFNKDMQGLCKAWKRRHESACKQKTPAQRLKWAKPFIGKDRYDSSIVVDTSHPGFAQVQPVLEAVQEWFDSLILIAKRHGNADAVRDFEGWTQGWEEQTPADVYYAEFPEHKASK